jgi:hypothetical protein
LRARDEYSEKLTPFHYFSIQQLRRYSLIRRIDLDVSPQADRRTTLMLLDSVLEEPMLLNGLVKRPITVFAVLIPIVLDCVVTLFLHRPNTSRHGSGGLMTLRTIKSIIARTSIGTTVSTSSIRIRSYNSTRRRGQLGIIGTLTVQRKVPETVSLVETTHPVKADAFGTQLVDVRLVANHQATSTGATGDVLQNAMQRDGGSAFQVL